MTYRRMLLLTCVSLLSLLTVASPAFAAGADDTLPGMRTDWFPTLGGITRTIDASHDVYRVYLEAGEPFSFSLSELAADANLYLYVPGSLDFASGIYAQSTTSGNETVSGVANQDGYWSVDVRQAGPGSCSYTLTGTFGESADDNVPGVALPASPVDLALDCYSEWQDVFSVWLNTGDTISLTLATTKTDADTFSPQLALFAPGTRDVWTDAPLASSSATLSYQAPAPGTYCVNLYSGSHESAGAGTVRLSYSLARVPVTPVHRFYNPGNGTHFFTPSDDEMRNVIARYSNVYRYEGVAYSVNPLANTQPLYRFYNVRSASHFYTASATERDMVIRTWPNVFRYEGETYSVSPDPGTPQQAKSAVYRFYNVRNGSHFFTSSATERDIVIANWSNVYHYEGPVFWLGM